MSDWELVEISAREPESSSEESAESDQGGLSTGVETLHSNFWQDASHLSEAENRHMQVLVSAGMIPEDHIASVEPTRKLHWLVEELNGRIDPDGLSIPLKGLEIDDIEIYQKTENHETVLKLQFVEKDGQKLERFFSLIPEASESNLKANFYNNRLYLRW